MANADARGHRRAAGLMAARNEEISIILAELAESAGAIARSWHLAISAVGSDPERAMGQLSDAETRLDNHVRLELADSLRIIRSAIKTLDAELPDKC